MVGALSFGRMAVISPSQLATLLLLLISGRCDGFGSTLIPSSTTHISFQAAPHSRASYTTNIHTINNCRGHQLQRTRASSQSSSVIDRRGSSHRLFSSNSVTSSTSRSDDDNSGRSKTGRPDWALPWMPTWLITLRPITQFIVGLFLYIFHLRVLTQHGITFPVQLIPNDEGWFQSIGLDSVAGILSLFGMVWLRKASLKHNNGGKVVIPSIWSDPTESEAPWRLRSKNKTNTKSNRDKSSDDTTIDGGAPHVRSTSIIAFILLTFGYFSTGRFSLLFENALYAAAGYGVPLTVPMHRR